MIRKKLAVNKQKIIAEYISGTDSFDALGVKYGIKARTIQTWVWAYRLKNPDPVVAAEGPDDIKALKKQLGDALLKNELLEEILRLSEEQTGLELRKKAGTRQS